MAMEKVVRPDFYLAAAIEALGYAKEEGACICCGGVHISLPMMDALGLYELTTKWCAVPGSLTASIGTIERALKVKGFVPPSEPESLKTEARRVFGACHGRCGEAPCILWNQENQRKIAHRAVRASHEADLAADCLAAYRETDTLYGAAEVSPIGTVMAEKIARDFDPSQNPDSWFVVDADSNVIVGRVVFAPGYVRHAFNENNVALIQGEKFGAGIDTSEPPF